MVSNYDEAGDEIRPSAYDPVSIGGGGKTWRSVAEDQPWFANMPTDINSARQQAQSEFDRTGGPSQYLTPEAQELYGRNPLQEAFHLAGEVFDPLGAAGVPSNTELLRRTGIPADRLPAPIQHGLDIVRPSFAAGPEAALRIGAEIAGGGLVGGELGGLIGGDRGREIGETIGEFAGPLVGHPAQRLAEHLGNAINDLGVELPRQEIGRGVREDTFFPRQAVRGGADVPDDIMEIYAKGSRGEELTAAESKRAQDFIQQSVIDNGPPSRERKVALGRASQNQEEITQRQENIRARRAGARETEPQPSPEEVKVVEDLRGSLPETVNQGVLGSNKPIEPSGYNASFDNGPLLPYGTPQRDLEGKIVPGQQGMIPADYGEPTPRITPAQAAEMEMAHGDMPIAQAINNPNGPTQFPSAPHALGAEGYQASLEGARGAGQAQEFPAQYRTGLGNVERGGQGSLWPEELLKTNDAIMESSNPAFREGVTTPRISPREAAELEMSGKPVAQATSNPERVIAARGGAQQPPEPPYKAPWMPGMEPEEPRGSFGATLKENAGDILRAPITIRSQYDLSAPGRQLLKALVAHPTLIAQTFRTQWQSLRSEEAYQAAQAVIEKAPWKVYRDIAGVDIADLASKREEQINSRLVEKLPGARQTERAYTAAINNARDWLFQNMLSQVDPSLLTESGLKNGGEAELKRIGKLVNASTGRGTLGKLAENSIAGQPLFWAPKMIAGNIQVPLSAAFSSSPIVRREAMRQMVAFVGTNLAILGTIKALGIADVEVDPRSSDFGLIRIGDRRYDTWAGYKPIATLIGRLGSGALDMSNNKTINTSEGEGVYNTKEFKDVMGNFLRSKLAPIPSEVLSQSFGRDFTGQKVDQATGGRIGHAAAALAAPLFGEQLLEEIGYLGKQGYEENGAAGAAKAIGTSAGANIPYFFGLGGGYYTPNQNDSGGLPKAPSLKLPSLPKVR